MLLKRSHDQVILVGAFKSKAEFDINEDYFYVLSKDRVLEAFSQDTNITII